MSGQGNIEEIARQVHDFIAATYLTRRRRPLADDEPLFSTGLIDSLGRADLVVFIEERFNVMLTPDELGIDRADTVTQIAALIASRAHA